MTDPLQSAVCAALLNVAEERDLSITVADVAALANAALVARLTNRRTASQVQLSDQQTAVMTGLVLGEQAPATARRLCLSTDTVKTHRRLAYKKLGAKSAAQAVAIAMSLGLLNPLASTTPIPAQRDRRTS